MPHLNSTDGYQNPQHIPENITFPQHDDSCQHDPPIPHQPFVIITNLILTAAGTPLMNSPKLHPQTFSKGTAPLTGI